MIMILPSIVLAYILVNLYGHILLKAGVQVSWKLCQTLQGCFTLSGYGTQDKERHFVLVPCEAPSSYYV